MKTLDRPSVQTAEHWSGGTAEQQSFGAANHQSRWAPSWTCQAPAPEKAKHWGLFTLGDRGLEQPSGGANGRPSNPESTTKWEAKSWGWKWDEHLGRNCERSNEQASTATQRRPYRQRRQQAVAGKSNRGWSMHVCMHKWMREWMNQTKRNQSEWIKMSQVQRNQKKRMKWSFCCEISWSATKIRSDEVESKSAGGNMFSQTRSSDDKLLQ